MKQLYELLFPIASVHGLPLSTSSQDNGNTIQLPLRQNLSKIQNDSRLEVNITSNELNTEAIHTSTSFIKTPSTNLPVMHTTGDMLGGFESNSTNSLNVPTTVRNLLGSEKKTLPFLTENYTTVSPSPSIVMHNHHFNRKMLLYILIPLGCLLAIVVSYCMVSLSKVSIQLLEKIVYSRTCFSLNSLCSLQAGSHLRARA